MGLPRLACPTSGALGPWGQWTGPWPLSGALERVWILWLLPELPEQSGGGSGCLEGMRERSGGGGAGLWPGASLGQQPHTAARTPGHLLIWLSPVGSQLGAATRRHRRGQSRLPRGCLPLSRPGPALCSPIAESTLRANSSSASSASHLHSPEARTGRHRSPAGQGSAGQSLVQARGWAVSSMLR